MSQKPTPFDDYAVWTLAGASRDGVVYAASIDPILLDVRLWAYDSVRKRWKILATSDRVSAPDDRDSYCLMSAAYNENSGRVDIFLESAQSCGFLFRFSTRVWPARFDGVLSAINFVDIQFDGTTGPSMHYLGENLIIAGSKREDFGSVIRLFKIEINFDADDHRTPLNTFTLTEVWASNPRNYFGPIRATTTGDKFILLERFNVMIFEPKFDKSIREWDQPISILLPSSLIRGIADHDFDEIIDLCSPPNCADRIWFMPLLEKMSESILTEKGELVENRKLSWPESDAGPCENAGPKKIAAASATHLFWIRDGGETVTEGGEMVEYEMKSKAFAPPSLQHSCLSILCSTIPAFRECADEKGAAKLRIPILSWRRYCR